MKKSISVLLIEDNDGDFVLTREMLKDAQEKHSSAINISLSRADSFKAAVEKISSERFDCFLLDLSLPDANGVDTFYCLRALTSNVPIVILSGLDDEASATKAVQAGAQDYLVKGSIDSALLVRSIKYAVERNEFLQEIQRIKEDALRAEKVKTEFLYHISDDIHQMLISAHNLAEQGKTVISTSQKEECCIKVSNLLHLISTSLDFVKDYSHLELDLFSLRVSPVAIQDLVDDVYESLGNHAVSNGAQIDVELENLGEKKFLLDKERLLQIIECFYKKFFLFASQPEIITLKIVPSSAGANNKNELSFSMSLGGQEVRVEERQVLFEALSQTDTSAFKKYGPTGLELSVSARIIALMGGKVWVTNTKQEGTVLHWTLAG